MMVHATLEIVAGESAVYRFTSDRVAWGRVKVMHGPEPDYVVESGDRLGAEIVATKALGARRRGEDFPLVINHAS